LLEKSIVINRANARPPIFHNDDDVDLRQSVNRGVPYGRKDWVDEKVAVYKLGVTINGRGRPRK